MTRHQTWPSRATHAYLALVLVAGLALVACNRIERLDKQTNELLDDLNDPRPPDQSRAASQKASQTTTSKLAVSGNLRSDVHRVLDAQGQQVEIFGQTRSSSSTPGHDNTMEAKAFTMARSGRYRYITIQRSWRVATGLPNASRRIPDLIGVRHDDRVDAFEIESQSDDRRELLRRLREGLDTLPPEHRGEFDTIVPDASVRGGWFDE